MKIANRKIALREKNRNSSISNCRRQRLSWGFCHKKKKKKKKWERKKVGKEMRFSFYRIFVRLLAVSAWKLSLIKFPSCSEFPLSRNFQMVFDSIKLYDNIVYGINFLPPPPARLQIGKCLNANRKCVYSWMQNRVTYARHLPEMNSRRKSGGDRVVKQK